MAIENPHHFVLKPQREGGGKEDQVFSTIIEGGGGGASRAFCQDLTRSCILSSFMHESFTD